MARLPFAVLTVIRTRPGLLAITLPVRSTVATLVLALLQEMRLVDVAGVSVATSLVLLPTSSVLRAATRTLVASLLLVTYTTNVSVLPDVVRTVIVALPSALAVTQPVEDTAARRGQELLQLSVSVDLIGERMASSLIRDPRATYASVCRGVGEVMVTALEGTLSAA